jgi:hypothetical protein
MRRTNLLLLCLILALLPALLVGQQATGTLKIHFLNVGQADAIYIAGRNLSSAFASLPADCEGARELQQRGATSQAVEAWRNACQGSLTERAKFGPIFGHFGEQRAELKAYQIEAQARRRAIVNEAIRLR